MSYSLGSLHVRCGGYHDISLGYERLIYVLDPISGIWYISLFRVPPNVPLSSEVYWRVYFTPTFAMDGLDDLVDVVDALLVQPIESETNFNNIIGLGVYNKSASVYTHAPSNDAGLLIVFGDNDVLQQSYVTTTASYVRLRVSNLWSSWLNYSPNDVDMLHGFTPLSLPISNPQSVFLDSYANIVESHTYAYVSFTDLNFVTTTGIYPSPLHYGGSLVDDYHYPTEMNGICIVSGNSVFVEQTYKAFDNNIYRRVFMNNAWGAWGHVYTGLLTLTPPLSTLSENLATIPQMVNCIGSGGGAIKIGCSDGYVYTSINHGVSWDVDIIFSDGGNVTAINCINDTWYCATYPFKIRKRNTNGSWTTQLDGSLESCGENLYIYNFTYDVTQSRIVASLGGHHVGTGYAGWNARLVDGSVEWILQFTSNASVATTHVEYWASSSGVALMQHDNGVWLIRENEPLLQIYSTTNVIWHSAVLGYDGALYIPDSNKVVRIDHNLDVSTKFTLDVGVTILCLKYHTDGFMYIFASNNKIYRSYDGYNYHLFYDDDIVTTNIKDAVSVGYDLVLAMSDGRFITIT